MMKRMGKWTKMEKQIQWKRERLKYTGENASVNMTRLQEKPNLPFLQTIVTNNCLHVNVRGRQAEWLDKKKQKNCNTTAAAAAAAADNDDGYSDDDDYDDGDDGDNDGADDHDDDKDDEDGVALSGKGDQTGWWLLWCEDIGKVWNGQAAIIIITRPWPAFRRTDRQTAPIIYKSSSSSSS